MRKIFAARLIELTEGSLIPFEVEDFGIVLFRNGHDIRAYQRLCPHRGMPLDLFGMIKEGILICGAHNFPFSADSGQYKREVPNCSNIRMYPVEIEGDSVFILIPTGQESDLVSTAQ